jgi:hypothetical protein
MKTMIAGVLAALALSGCVAVPYDPGPYYGGGPGYGPGYGPPAYYGPPVSFSFGYTYRDGGYRHGHRHYHR